METVAIRQRGAYEFESHYENLCALQNSCPIPAVKAHLKDGVLDINGDRVRASDWLPILNTLQINKSLTFVAVRSYYQLNIEERVRSKDITYQICRALRDCLAGSPSLKVIELQGLPLRERDLQVLIKGLAKNNTLQHLSLEHTSIGDDGLEIVCKGIQNSNSITSLNLTACGLSGRSGELLGKVIKLQAMRRHQEAWKGSLRYRRPDLDSMQGLRRITLNFNPMLGDQAAAALADTLKDDLWLKALDMQQCGITNVGAKSMLEILKYNTIVVVLDLRRNPLIDAELLRSIMEQLMINSHGKETDYPWMTAAAAGSEEGGGASSSEGKNKLKMAAAAAARRRRTRTLQNSFGRKTTIKVSSGGGKARGANVSGSRRSGGGNQSSSSGERSKGIPWRTALRASRYRGYPQHHVPGKASLFENLSGGEGEHDDTVLTVDYSGTETDPADTSHNESANDGRRLVRSDGEIESRATRLLRLELEQTRRRLHEETAARAGAEERMLELTVENNRLRSELEQSRQRQGVVDNDAFLENVEASFRQFHTFLDLLRDAGLGQLISLAGINQSQLVMPKANGTTSTSSRQPPVNGSHTSRPTTNPNQATSYNGFSANPTGSYGGLSANQGLPTRHSASDTVRQFPQIRLPDNYQSGRDPTMGSRGDEAPLTSTRRQAPFDEMYERLLHDVERSGASLISAKTLPASSNGFHRSTGVTSPPNRDGLSATYGGSKAGSAPTDRHGNGGVRGTDAVIPLTTNSSSSSNGGKPKQKTSSSSSKEGAAASRVALEKSPANSEKNGNNNNSANNYTTGDDYRSAIVSSPPLNPLDDYSPVKSDASVDKRDGWRLDDSSPVVAVLDSHDSTLDDKPAAARSATAAANHSDDNEDDEISEIEELVDTTHDQDDD